MCGKDQHVDVGGLVGCRESKGCNQLSSVTFIKWAASLTLKNGALKGDEVAAFRCVFIPEGS